MSWNDDLKISKWMKQVVASPWTLLTFSPKSWSWLHPHSLTPNFLHRATCHRWTIPSNLLSSQPWPKPPSLPKSVCLKVAGPLWSPNFSWLSGLITFCLSLQGQANVATKTHNSSRPSGFRSPSPVLGKLSSACFFFLVRPFFFLPAPSPLSPNRCNYLFLMS